MAGWLHDIFYTRARYLDRRDSSLQQQPRRARGAAGEHSSSYKSTARTSKENNCLCTSTSFLARHNMCVRVFDHYSHTHTILLLLSRTLLRALCSLLLPALSFQKHSVIELECQIKESHYLRIEFPCAPVDLFFFFLEMLVLCICTTLLL